MASLRRWILRVLTPALLTCYPALAGVPDSPFRQPISHQFALPRDLKGAAKKLCVDRDDIVYILTSKGVARLFGDRIALDQSYRPLADKIARDITVSNGKLYYLFDDEIVCNRDAGKFVIKLDTPYDNLAVNSLGEVLLAGKNRVARVHEGKISKMDWKQSEGIRKIYASEEKFYILAEKGIYEIEENRFKPIFEMENATCIAGLDGELFAGSSNGYYELKNRAHVTKVPSTNITALITSGQDLRAATTRGVWRRAPDGKFSYFASNRWLDSDDVLDLQINSKGDIWALTKSGLNQIEFRSMTLAEKAAWYENKIRQRHIRYGFCAELHLKTPGDVTTEEMIDTDNDGTWSNYYMASQAFHYGATGDETARRNAWETFDALERLESINPLKGFPARTFERVGFKVSDRDRWHEVGDGIWDWKAHTSSDEIIAHGFGSSVLYQVAARTPEEKKRIATFIGKMLDHIIRNDWYLIDVDGKPTLWGRWNPEYVNAYPFSVFDRRLNSAEIIGLLQFGYKITGNDTYKQKAYELIEKHGYLENILSPMSRVGPSPQVHKGIEMGDEWNHSDDLLGFDAYWVLYHFAFTDELKAKYAAVIRDHWAVEKVERNPLWNFIYASTGAGDYDLEGALWTLRGFPLDMIDWTVINSHRQDITRKPPNFRHQQLEELLPPYERHMTRWNSQPFVLDGGSGGAIELAGDEFLLPYWMGRYLKQID
jgi:hypothetical protein